MSIQCRTCGAMVFNPNAKNIFDEDNDEILLNIEVLTGILIKEEQNMPSYICTCCHLDLYHSIAFRERCIRTENSLQTTKDKVEIEPQDPLNGSTTETNLIEEITIKVETQRESAEDKTLEQPIDKPNPTNLTQRRSQRACKQVAKTPPKELTAKRKTSQKLASPAKAPPVVKSSNQIVSSPQSIGDHFEKRLSTSTEELNKDITEKREIEFDNKLSAPSQIPLPIQDVKPKTFEELLPKEDHGEVTKPKPKKKKKYPVTKRPLNPKVFICDLCGYQSQTPRSLNIHILRHKGEKNFECDECGLKYYCKSILKTHIRVKHRGEKPFACKFCDQRFCSPTEHNRHEQVKHIRDFKYECKICGKKYLTKSCLNKHEFLHTGLKPYRCDLCNVAFPRKPGLRIHCRTQQHQKREMEAQNNQVSVINTIMTPDESIVFSNCIIIEQLVDS